MQVCLNLPGIQEGVLYCACTRRRDITKPSYIPLSNFGSPTLALSLSLSLSLSLTHTHTHDHTHAHACAHTLARSCKSRIGNRGAKLLAKGLAENDHLKSLRLEKSGIRNRGAIKLAEALKHNNALAGKTKECLASASAFNQRSRDSNARTRCLLGVS